VCGTRSFPFDFTCVALIVGMTEKNIPEHIDLFFRQSLMINGRLPVVWAAGGQFDLLQMLHNEADADVGEFGLGLDGIPKTDEQNVNTLPWAVKHITCNEDYQALCKEPYKFCATCWLERIDHKQPEQRQYDVPRGRVAWHPGWRQHQLTGRVLAFTILQAMKDAVEWIRSINSRGEPNDLPLGDMSDYYENIRQKVVGLDPSLGTCHRINTTLPGRVCHISMKGRTQYTPRNHPQNTSITSILKPAPDGYMPQNMRTTALYEGPDAPNACLELPPGAVDVVAQILGGIDPHAKRRRQFANSTTSMATDTDSVSVESEGAAGIAYEVASASEGTSSGATEEGVAFYTESLFDDDRQEIVPGRGWEVFDEPQGYCDGTYESVCAKSTQSRVSALRARSLFQ
jgi:hypothetical protein